MRSLETCTSGYLVVQYRHLSSSMEVLASILIVHMINTLLVGALCSIGPNTPTAKSDTSTCPATMLLTSLRPRLIGRNEYSFNLLLQCLYV
jgi:hypothetical protein